MTQPNDPIAIVVQDMTLKQMIEAIRAAKAQRDASTRTYFSLLRDVEVSGKWRALAPTFEMFLMREDLGSPSEYRHACTALDLIPAETIDTIGMVAAAKAVRLPDDQRAAAIADLEKAAKKSGPLSSIKVNPIIRKHMPPAPPARIEVGPAAPPPSQGFDLHVARREPMAIARALAARLSREEVRALQAALDAIAA